MISYPKFFTPMAHEPGDEKRLERIKKEFKDGFKFLKSFRHDRVVSVFGSSKIKEGHPIYEQARKFGRLAAEQGFTIVTGGGPGIMEAANRGALEAGGRSVGLCIELPDHYTEPKNQYMQESISFYYFFVRKVMLAHVGQAYIFFPGGLGTLDEFFEISTLIATHKLHAPVPVILVGEKYWRSLRNWLEQELEEKFRTLYEQELGKWQITDTAQKALELIKDIPRRVPRHESL